MRPLLSVIIPARNEFPQIVFTMHSILSCWTQCGFKPNEIEIIIVENASTDRQAPKYGTGGTTDYLMTRGAYFNRILRVVYDPCAGNHSARNTGARVARGKYLYFSDGHMSLENNFFKYILETVEKYGGIVHGQLQFSGAYPPTDASGGYGYTLVIGDQLKERWNNYKLADTPFYVLGQGAWGVAVKRDEFINFRGWENPHRAYGGEFYLSKKWYMLGSHVMVDPRAIGYHLAAPRGYVYFQENYIENILGLLFALGADEWRERSYINYLRTHNKAILDKIMARGEREYAEDRAWIAKRAKYTFNELLTERPWDKMNMSLHGKANGHLLVYHWSILDLIMQSPIALEAYKNSKYQKQLAQFIQTKLPDFIYKAEEYPDLTRFKDMIE